MDVPLQLRRFAPMPTRPDAPTVDRQIGWYHAACEDGIYVIRNGQGEELARDVDWIELCDRLGWYPKDPTVLDLHAQRAAEKQAARERDAADVREGRRSAEQVNCDNSLVHGLMDRLHMRRELGVRNPAPPEADDTVVLATASIRIAIPKRSATPLPSRPTPPAVGETTTICGYSVTAKLCKGANRDRPIFYLYSRSGELLSAAYDWDRWCHILGWYPLEGLEPCSSIPRELAAPEGPKTPPKPKGPTTLNRHHFKSRDEIPEPWLYVGRGNALGNPFTRDEHGPNALPLYRKWLWEKISTRDPAVLAELGKITAETGLVCSCAPRPCHADVIIKAWKWAKDRAVLAGYRKDPNEAAPEWATEVATDTAVPVIETREATNLSLFGE